MFYMKATSDRDEMEDMGQALVSLIIKRKALRAVDGGSGHEQGESRRQ